METRDYLPLMDAAVQQAEESWAEGGIPIGAVLADRSGTIVARGHNEHEQSGDATAHAEVMCVRHAGRRRDWRELTLVTTHSPCTMCAGTAALLKIPRVVVGQNVLVHPDPALRDIVVPAHELLRNCNTEVVILDDPRCEAMLERLAKEKPELLTEGVGD